MLIDCSQHLKSELIVVEGKSAASAVQRVRDRQTQAVMSMQGKVPNAAAGSAKKLLSNIQVRALLVALDPAGVGELPLEEIRYQRVIVLTDPDADGMHARVLLILFFYIHLRTIIEQGLLYVVYAPLYRIDSHIKSRSFMAYTKSDYDEILQSLNELGEHDPEIIRYKGLGSLDQQTLHQYCIDTQGRRIRQLSVNDCEALLSTMRRIKS